MVIPLVHFKTKDEHNMQRDAIRFLRNGIVTTIKPEFASETLLDYLRLREKSKGTKEGCCEGDCGACTVALGSIKNGKLVYEPVNACIMLLGQIDGKDLITVDDLAAGGTLHPVQKAMVELHGSQCGFCTPGIVMSLFVLYHRGYDASRDTINDWLSGNLCRCTGYRPIADAARKAFVERTEDWLDAEFEVRGRALETLDDQQDVHCEFKQGFLAAPATLESLCKLAAANPDATLVSGATDVGLWITKQMQNLEKIILTGRVEGFRAIENGKDELTIAAGATYEEAHQALANIAPDLDLLLRRIGSRQVRASGTIGGNIANGSPIGDTPPAFIALDARLQLRSGDKKREIPLEDFFVDYGKQDRLPGEVVTGITIPKLAQAQTFKCFKISKRFDQDISSVLIACRFTVEKQTIVEARIAYGGMAATPKRAKICESLLQNCSLSDVIQIDKAVAALAQDFTPMSDMRASAQYRMKVAGNLLLKAIEETRVSDTSNTRLAYVGEVA